MYLYMCDCSDTAEDMTVDSRDPKDFNIKDDNAINIEHHSNTSNTPPPSNTSLPWDSEDINMADDDHVKNKRNSDILDDNEITFRNKLNDVESIDVHEIKEELNIDSSNSNEHRDNSPMEHNISNSNNSNGEDVRMDELNESKEQKTPSSSPSPNLVKLMADQQQIGRQSSPTTSCNLPKLRLNALLASDPALKPDAKDLKLIQEEAETHHRKAQLAHSITHTDDMDTLMENAVNTLTVNQVIKSVPSTLETVPPPPPPPHHRMKVFMCIPCGIGFSSPSTLEAHQAYYCSHRHKDTEENAIPSGSVVEKTVPSPATVTINSSYATQVQATSEPATKVHKTGKQYACTQCSYSADKKVSLNRHMRIHQASPASAPNTNATASNAIVLNAQMDESSTQQIDRYCSDCDIRFNNVKTYRAHKQHYCSSRRADGSHIPKLEISNSSHNNKNLNTATSSGSGVTSPQNRTKTPVPSTVLAAAAAAAAAVNVSSATPSSPFLLLPTNPVLIIPYSVVRSASIIGGPTTFSLPGVMNPDASCFALENGNLKRIATVVNINNTLNNISNVINNNNSNSNLHEELAQNQRTPNNNNNNNNNNSGDVIGASSKIHKYNTEDSRESTPKSSKERAYRESTPLDLSLRRSPITTFLQQRQQQRLHSDNADHSTNEERHHLDRGSDVVSTSMDRDNLSHDESGSITPEQIVCAPSLPNSPTMTPSPCRKTISPRSSGACSNSSISPPTNPAMSINTINNSQTSTATNLLDNLQFRSMLPADLLNPLLAKQNLELALKLSVAAAAVNNSTAASIAPHSTNSAELAVAAAAAAAATGRAQLLGLPVLQSAVTAPSAGTTVPSNNQPQIYVKQGVSKCKECNIVFCKYENYLAHKQHYCSARNQDVSDVEVKTSPTPPMMGVTSASDNVTPVAYQQLICAACGIKYTSLDNLRAHQNYYCPKGVGATSLPPVTVTPGTVTAAAPAVVASDPLAVVSKEKCTKCNTAHEFSSPCPISTVLQQQQQQQQKQQHHHHHHQLQQQHHQQQHTASFVTSSNQNVYKCPLCDVISLTATESRKHMETHGTVKAFRCTICGYKGNTLRGMRTHIRMHVDKKTTNDFNEEHYMTCILEEENNENVASAALATATASVSVAAAPATSATTVNDQLVKQQHHHHQQQQQQQQHYQQTSTVDLQQQQQQQQQIFNCDVCNYTSTYKGNVLRHMKLLHPHIITDSPSVSPDVAGHISGGPDTNDVSSLTSSHNGDNSFHNCTIKTEPLENINQSSNPSGIVMNNSRDHDNNNAFVTNVGQQHLSTTASNDNLTIMTNIKTEPVELVVTQQRSTISPIRNNQSIRSPTTALPPPPSTLTHTSSASASSSSSLLLEESIINQKYCQSCDISFNYLKTYLAHKQFYCKNKMKLAECNDNSNSNALTISNTDNIITSSSALSAPSGVPTALVSSNASMTIQKTEDSIQQEAAT